MYYNKIDKKKKGKKNQFNREQKAQNKKIYKRKILR